MTVGWPGRVERPGSADRARVPCGNDHVMATRPCNQPLKDGGRCSKRIGLKGRCGAEHAPAAVAVATRPTATVTAMNDPFATATAPPSLPSDIEDLGAAQAASDDVIAAKAHLIGRDHVRDRIRVEWIVNDITPEPDGWITIHGSHNSRGIAWGRWPDTAKTVHPDTGTYKDPDGFDRAGWKTRLQSAYAPSSPKSNALVLRSPAPQ